MAEPEVTCAFRWVFRFVGVRSPGSLGACLLGLVAVSACGGSGGGGGPDADGGPAGDAAAPVVPPPDINLVVDANRDGTLERTVGTDDVSEDAWAEGAGAIFLVNIDDDDADGKADTADNVVNGTADELDLARVALAPWADAPDDAIGSVTVNEGARDHVRLFRKTDEGWEAVDLTRPLTLGAADIRAGLEFGVEALDFVRSATAVWQGEVQITFEVTKTVGPIGSDTVVLRAAPWFINHNLRAFDRVYYADFSMRLTSTLGPVLEEEGIEAQVVSSEDYASGGSDIWFEDWMQTGWTAMPAVAGGGGVHGMIIYNARPWGRSPGPAPLKVLREEYLGPDRGVAALYSPNDQGQGSTFDSHGNHDALPPSPDAPLGRIMTGSGVLPSTWAFYMAQRVQPPISLNTDWLVVGHVDEVYAVAKANTPRGYKMLENAPALARELFEGWQEDGHGDAPVFPGLVDFDNIDWSTTVDDILSSPALMAANQEAQVEIAAMRATLKAATGMTDSDFVEVPVLYEELDGYKVAYLPDTANVRVVSEGMTLIFPQPHGPIVEGEDLFETFLVSHVTDAQWGLGDGVTGPKVRFGDSWDYHVRLGDIHCASNWSAPPSNEDSAWWESVKGAEP